MWKSDQQGQEQMGRKVVAYWGRMGMLTSTGVIAVVKGVDESVKYSKSISIISIR